MYYICAYCMHFHDDHSLSAANNSRKHHRTWLGDCDRKPFGSCLPDKCMGLMTESPDWSLVHDEGHCYQNPWLPAAETFLPHCHTIYVSTLSQTGDRISFALAGSLYVLVSLSSLYGHLARRRKLRQILDTFIDDSFLDETTLWRTDLYLVSSPMALIELLTLELRNPWLKHYVCFMLVC